MKTETRTYYEVWIERNGEYFSRRYWPQEESGVMEALTVADIKGLATGLKDKVCKITQTYEEVKK